MPSISSLFKSSTPATSADPVFHAKVAKNGDIVLYLSKKAQGTGLKRFLWRKDMEARATLASKVQDNLQTLKNNGQAIRFMGMPERLATTDDILPLIKENTGVRVALRQFLQRQGIEDKLDFVVKAQEFVGRPSFEAARALLDQIDEVNLTGKLAEQLRQAAALYLKDPEGGVDGAILAMEAANKHLAAMLTEKYHEMVMQTA
jgi:hypothetical protein